GPAQDPGGDRRPPLPRIADADWRRKLRAWGAEGDPAGRGPEAWRRDHGRARGRYGAPHGRAAGRPGQGAGTRQTCGGRVGESLLHRQEGDRAQPGRSEKTRDARTTPGGSADTTPTLREVAPPHLWGGGGQRPPEGLVRAGTGGEQARAGWSAPGPAAPRGARALDRARDESTPRRPAGTW